MNRKTLFFLWVILTIISGSLAAQGPQHGGEMAVAGLIDSVEILRDEWGVAHIYASNSHDLFFAQGYTQAQDRWWQMELFRHTGSGTIQELTGQNDAVMGTDLYLRTLGFRQIAERELVESYGEDDVTILQAFADGVNAYIMNREPGELAFEYNALGLAGVSIEIQPWTPVDTIVWGKVMALNLSGNEGYERLLSRLSTSIDADMLADWNVPWPYGEKATILWPEDLPLGAEAANIHPDEQNAGIIGLDTRLVGNFDMEDMPVGLGYGENIGSNNWVAHGNITATGSPLMANDMHLGIQMPSIWYEIGLHCVPVSDECPFNVTGFAFSTTPLVVAGHNDTISWAHTNTGPDVQDLYQIRVNPENALQYEWNGEWRDMTVREETLYFGDGAEPITFQVRSTHLGPIVNDDIHGFNNEDPVALKWTAFEMGTLLKAVKLLNLAQNWDDFREAVSYWDVPAQNIIYADINGNIGYQTPGNIPIRAAGHSGTLPVPGWTDEYEWRGYIPFNTLPRIYNPERGYISTANQPVVPMEYYDWLAGEIGDQFGEDANYVMDYWWAMGYRGDRINTLLEDLQPHTIETFQQMHADNYDGSAAEILPFLLSLDIDDTALADMRDWLGEWDMQMHMDSARAPLYAFFWTHLMDNLYNDQFAGVYRASGGNNHWWATYLLMQEPENVWWDDVNTANKIETRDDIVLKSFEEAVIGTVEALGENRDDWRWGTLHTTTFVNNPLGISGIAPIENMVNRGPVAVSGTGNAINAMGWSTTSGSFESAHGPSERVIYDLSNWDNSLSIHPTGQSGHPLNAHYADMIDPWRNIDYHPMLWSREQVEAATVATLLLVPED
jgi:penicillin G amidase